VWLQVLTLTPSATTTTSMPGGSSGCGYSRIEPYATGPYGDSSSGSSHYQQQRWRRRQQWQWVQPLGAVAYGGRGPLSVAAGPYTDALSSHQQQQQRRRRRQQQQQQRQWVQPLDCDVQGEMWRQRQRVQPHGWCGAWRWRCKWEQVRTLSSTADTSIYLCSLARPEVSSTSSRCDRNQDEEMVLSITWMAAVGRVGPA
jgi:hypothetical protein